MPQRTCSVPGCAKPVSARGWCATHYWRWTKHGDPLVVKHKHDGNRIDPTERKHCEHCGAEFGPTPGRGRTQWARARFCSSVCRSGSRKINDGRTNRQRWHDKRTDWAAWWERRRRIEDRAELKAWKPKVGPHCRVSQRPQARLFIGSTCRACGERWIQYAARIDSDLCSRCTKAKWRMNDRRRAKYYGVEHEHIDRHLVFAGDNHVCQICRRKTKGKYPHPRSPTIDHIIPLSRGGPDVRHNVQTACLECNVRKHNGAANDQLRLAVAA